MKNTELTKKELLYCEQRLRSLEPVLTKDNLYLIRQFALSINFTTKSKYYIDGAIEPQINDRLFELSYIFKRNIENYPNDNESAISKNRIKNILTDTDLRDIIQLFNTQKDTETVLNILDYTYQQLQNYSTGNKLAKNNHNGTSLNDLLIAVKLEDKNTHQGAIETYKEAYKLLFCTNDINSYGNVKKLRELVNKIFSITLRDKDIKKTKNAWWTS